MWAHISYWSQTLNYSSHNWCTIWNNAWKSSHRFYCYIMLEIQLSDACTSFKELWGILNCVRMCLSAYILLIITVCHQFCHYLTDSVDSEREDPSNTNIQPSLLSTDVSLSPRNSLQSNFLGQLQECLELNKQLRKFLEECIQRRKSHENNCASSEEEVSWCSNCDFYYGRQH